MARQINCGEENTAGKAGANEGDERLLGECFFIVYKYTNKIEVGTVIEWDRLHHNQKRLYLDSMRSAYEFADKKYHNIADSLKGTGFKKTNDAVSGLCGYSSCITVSQCG